MKASLILVVCLAGMSVQQSLFWPFPAQTRFQYLPEWMKLNGQIQPERSSNPQGKEARVDANVYYANPLNPARRGPLVHYDPYYQYYDHSQDAAHEGRLGVASGYDATGPAARIFGALPFLFFNTAFFSAKTTTSTTTTTSTLTTASVQSCIPLGSFSSDAMMNAFTNQCARRKRAVLIEDMDLVDPIEATETLEVEQSVAPAELKEKREIHQPDVESSKDQAVDAPSEARDRYGRQIYFFTATTTSTEYFFLSEVVRRTVNLGSSLVCLPSDYVVC